MLLIRSFAWIDCYLNIISYVPISKHATYLIYIFIFSEYFLSSFSVNLAIPTVVIVIFLFCPIANLVSCLFQSPSFPRISEFILVFIPLFP